mmetsp:Transcript_2785/g.7306  ORF Transcript_2785/g.7306 Transcript_2785/m.7306 type:complete len:291 (-) Transcript_2785:759-1631(-)
MHPGTPPARRRACPMQRRPAASIPPCGLGWPRDQPQRYHPSPNHRRGASRINTTTPLPYRRAATTFPRSSRTTRPRRSGGGRWTARRTPRPPRRRHGSRRGRRPGQAPSRCAPAPGIPRRGIARPRCRSSHPRDLHGRAISAMHCPTTARWQSPSSGGAPQGIPPASLYSPSGSRTPTRTRRSSPRPARSVRGTAHCTFPSRLHRRPRSRPRTSNPPIPPPPRTPNWAAAVPLSPPRSSRRCPTILRPYRAVHRPGTTGTPAHPSRTTIPSCVRPHRSSIESSGDRHGGI